MKIRNIILVSALFTSSLSIFAQEPSNNVITIQPLFEYPTAPENIVDLEKKCNYLVEHFWDAFDVKSKKVVDQNALTHAFSVFVTPMQWADKKVAHDATDKLLSRLAKNPSLLLQMTKAAEENIYGPRSSMWIDEIYIKFLTALVNNKKVPELYRSRYGNQLKPLEASLTGNTAPSFKFVNMLGEEKVFAPSGNYTLIEFGDPTCSDCRMSALRLEANATISNLVKTGKLNIVFMIPSESGDWSNETKNYPSSWIVGASDTVDEYYDIRSTPSFYIIGPNGKIIKKNADVVTAINTIISETNK